MWCCGWTALQATKFISRPLSPFGTLGDGGYEHSSSDWAEAEMRMQNGCK